MKASQGNAGNVATAFAHVHGLGVDPGDGMLYAGTHYGVFRIPANGTPTQVGPTRDYMGFTVAGPGHFLASGHPAIGENSPGNLGLLESTNAGKDWWTVSLRGEADFHALDTRGGTTVGYSGGVLMASTDNRSWERRSTVQLRDFAISAVDPNRVLATTPNGLASSSDGGRTFVPVSGAPALVLVTVADNGTAFGVTADGTVHASIDDGLAWEARGSIGGRPEALTATDASVHVATAKGVFDSGDGGRTFTTRFAITT